MPLDIQVSVYNGVGIQVRSIDLLRFAEYEKLAGIACCCLELVRMEGHSYIVLRSLYSCVCNNLYLLQLMIDRQCVTKVNTKHVFFVFLFAAERSIDCRKFKKGFQLPTLLEQLQSVLGQYPDDGQILKVYLMVLKY